MLCLPAVANIKTNDEHSEEEHLKTDRPQSGQRDQTSSQQKVRQKNFATTSKMEVIMKSKSKLKRVVKKKENSDIAS